MQTLQQEAMVLQNHFIAVIKGLGPIRRKFAFFINIFKSNEAYKFNILSSFKKNMKLKCYEDMKYSCPFLLRNKIIS